MIAWDDLKYFLAAARTGSLAAAGIKLNTSATTVGRRVQRLETRLRATLFTRSAGGLQLTPAGIRLAEASGQVELAIDNALVTQENVPVATVRISSPEGFGTLVLAPALHTLVAAQPNIAIELAAWAGSPSPSRREVDMAITLSPPDSARLRVEKLSDFEVGLYCSAGFRDRFGEPQTIAALRGLPMTGFIDDMLYAPELRYIDDLGPGLRPRLTSTSSRAQLELIGSGSGIGMLPCFMAAQDRRLCRVMAVTVASRRSLWLATHEEIFGTARHRAVRSWLFETIAAIAADLVPTPAAPA